MNAHSLIIALTDKRWFVHRGLGWLITLAFCFGLLGLPARQAAAATFTELNPLQGTIADGSSTQTGCAYWPTSRYFMVDESFTVNDLNVRFNASHESRGQIQVTLTSPAGTKRVILSPSGDGNDHYDIRLDGDATGSLNDNNADTIADPVDRSVQQANLNDFEGENAHGAWQMTICDTTNGTVGTINAATALEFDGTVVTPIPLNHVSGPAQAEIYYLPFPEDQLWTAMNTIFGAGRSVSGDDTCGNYSGLDGNPREPFINYIGIMIPDAGTVLAYDHWEDGYDNDLSFPEQNSTQVWGDGNLLNGTAPKDADDVLAAGQMLILNDAMLTSNLQAVLDFDARDKLGASRPIVVIRSGWADGSQTMFGTADEVYPTANWGTEYRLPVGENADLNQMFQYTGVSVMAAVDGTVVRIDKDANGSAEQTCNLNQGESCQWDDGSSPVIGNGLNRGSRITSNAWHPIQVSLLTGDYCAGFATRSYTLTPVSHWSSSYYSPVSTITTAAGPGGDDAPTTIHLYNPNAASINVAYDYASGYAGYVPVAANSSSTLVVPAGEGVHFYNVITPPVNLNNNVRDEFGTVAYNNNNGSMNWAANWTETGDDNAADGGTIYIIGGFTDHLRFRENSAANDAISRRVNLSAYSTATLSFDIDGTNIDGTDDISILVSANGTDFVELERFNGDPGAVTRSYDISGYLSAQTTIRFIVRDTLETTGNGDGNYWQIDNVNIAASHSAPATPGNNVFYAVGSVDSDTKGNGSTNASYDWGFTLVPEKLMTQALIAGWAPGDDPTFVGSAAENTAPIWLTGGHPVGSLTPNASYTVCIDDGGNGGASTDPLSGRTYDRTIAGISPRSQVKVYNGGAPVAGQDQTGMQIWVCDGSDTLITAAWGADPMVAEDGKPGLDMGYTIRNQAPWRTAKSAALQVDQNGNGLYDEGDTVRYSILVANTGLAGIAGLTVSDTLPANVTYVAGSTRLTDHNGAVSTIADLGSYMYGTLPPSRSFTISFDATINPTNPFVATRTNVAVVTDGKLTLNPAVTINVQNPPVKVGTIGNYVWLDEDGDGDQDAGEAGIQNALVSVSNGAVTYTTYTDDKGGYLFTDLPVGSWTVTVTLPPGLIQTYDEDGIATPDASVVNLGTGVQHLSADFGYNWATPTETNTGGAGATGAIGDRVWSDADGDGKQDYDETGMAGVTLELYTAGPDGRFGTADDVLAGTDVTDSGGFYLFDNLAAGAYVVKIATPPAGYEQSGDPDSFAAGCAANCDHQTTTPILIGPGDVFINADFGYVSNAAAVGSIGDTLWLDADRNGAQNGAEPGLPGVTVALIQDANGNGAWDAGEPILSSDVTDEAGKYLFAGLPAGSGQDYLVWVDDTNNILGELAQTYDSNGVGSPNISAVANLSAAGNDAQDFGYAPPNHDAGEGLIGDTVFLDVDADSQPDPGEGMQGVRVKLYNASDYSLAGTTTTDANGRYFFGGLAAGSYYVQVQTGSLPYSGLSNTVDPDGGSDSTSAVTLPAGGVNLAQDFGYRDASQPNTIGGVLWNDVNANGALDGGEGTRFAGVTVALRSPSGRLIATTTTGANGEYSFTNLPDGEYRVDVIDAAQNLYGFWKSTGTAHGSDNNSQTDTYAVAVAGGQVNTTADFGYYNSSAGLGNFIWIDMDEDGLQDAGEPGLAGMEVTLTITYPNGAVSVVKTVSDANGAYSFSGLLQDEDLGGLGGDQPSYRLSVALPAGFLVSPANQGLDDTLDSDGVDQGDGSATAPVGQAPNLSQVLRGLTNGDYDFGLCGKPTVALVADLAAGVVEGAIQVTWRSLDETGLIAFKLYRSTGMDGEKSLLAFLPVDHPGQPGEASYIYPDVTAGQGVVYYYWLEMILQNGFTEIIEPPVSAGLNLPEPGPQPTPEPTPEPGSGSEPEPADRKVFLPMVLR